MYKLTYCQAVPINGFNDDCYIDNYGQEAIFDTKIEMNDFINKNNIEIEDTLFINKPTEKQIKYFTLLSNKWIHNNINSMKNHEQSIYNLICIVKKNLINNTIDISDMKDAISLIKNEL